MQNNFENKTEGDFRFFDSRHVIDFTEDLIEEIESLIIPKILSFANENDFEKICRITDSEIKSFIVGLKKCGFLQLEKNI